MDYNDIDKDPDYNEGSSSWPSVVGVERLTKTLPTSRSLDRTIPLDKYSIFAGVFQLTLILVIAILETAR
jgi:hypothetical protein